MRHLLALSFIVAFVLFLCFLVFPIAPRFRHRVMWWDWIAAVLSMPDWLLHLSISNCPFTQSFTPSFVRVTK